MVWDKGNKMHTRAALLKYHTRKRTREQTGVSTANGKDQTPDELRGILSFSQPLFLCVCLYFFGEQGMRDSDYQNLNNWLFFSAFNH